VGGKRYEKREEERTVEVGDEEEEEQRMATSWLEKCWILILARRKNPPIRLPVWDESIADRLREP
jgi:hypothetical protein